MSEPVAVGIIVKQILKQSKRKRLVRKIMRVKLVLVSQEGEK